MFLNNFYNLLVKWNRWVRSQSNEQKIMSNDQKTINFFKHIYVMPL
jgi:hypothetical protein